jgi:hypothetical protein
MKIIRIASTVVLFVTLPSLSVAQRNGLNPHGVLTVNVGCDACHTTEGWSPTKVPLEFDHNAATNFPLTDSHERVPCATCHLDLMFDAPKITTAGCTECHVDVHRGRLSSDCSSCHKTTLFSDIRGIEIHAKTLFPLSGSHTQVSCESCHPSDRGGAYSLQESECISCHVSDYNGAQPIDHVAAGFSTQCQECHNTLAWAFNVAFDHVTASGGFALLGRHMQIRCSSCHSGGTGEPIFNPSSQDDCFACHQSDYEREHAGTGFPTTCGSCHTNDSWEGATFADHDAVAFPIFSGAHRGRWDSCQTCHTTANDFRSFTCFNCHEHDRARMDEKHREESGYVYQSNACYSCHPRGRAED